MLSIPKDIFINHIFNNLDYIEIERLKFVNKDLKKIVDTFNRDRKKQNFEFIVKNKDYYAFNEYTKIYNHRCIGKYGDIYMINRYLKFNNINEIIISLCMRKEFHYISNYFLFQKEIYSCLTKMIFKGLTLTDKGELLFKEILKSGNLELIKKLNLQPLSILQRTLKSIPYIMKYCIESNNIELVDFAFNNINVKYHLNECLSYSTYNIKIFNYFISKGAYITDYVFDFHCMNDYVSVDKLDDCFRMIDYLIYNYPEHCRIKHILNVLKKNSPIYNYLINRIN